MPIKKSGFILLLLALSSVSLLVYSSGIVAPQPVPEKLPVNCPHIHCCDQVQELPVISSWDMMTQIMLRSAA